MSNFTPLEDPDKFNEQLHEELHPRASVTFAGDETYLKPGRPFDPEHVTRLFMDYGQLLEATRSWRPRG